MKPSSLVLCSTLALGVLATATSEACSGAQTCQPTRFFPRMGMTIPANAPALHWAPTRDMGPDGMPATLRRVDADGVTMLTGAPHRVTGFDFALPAPLTVDAEYELSVSYQCSSSASRTGSASHRFRVGPTATLPSTLGTLTVSPASFGRQIVYPSPLSSWCQANAGTESVSIDLAPSSEAMPWTALLQATEVTVDGVRWSYSNAPSYFVPLEMPVRIYSVCASADADAGAPGYGPRFAPGPHAVAVTFGLPGTTQTWQLTTTVHFTCGASTESDAGLPQADAGGAAQGGGGGCTVGRGSPSARVYGLGAMVALALVRRRRRVLRCV